MSLLIWLVIGTHKRRLITGSVDTGDSAIQCPDLLLAIFNNVTIDSESCDGSILDTCTNKTIVNTTLGASCTRKTFSSKIFVYYFGFIPVFQTQCHIHVLTLRQLFRNIRFHVLCNCVTKIFLSFLTNERFVVLSDDGLQTCLHYITSGGTTYLSVWNNDATVVEPTFQQFSCYVRIVGSSVAQLT